MSDDEMTNYRVKIQMIYSDVVHVEAPNKKEAITAALQECCEEFESVYSVEAEEE